MNRYLKLQFKGLIGKPAKVWPKIYVHDNDDSEGVGAVSFYGFGSVVTVGVKFERSW